MICRNSTKILVYKMIHSCDTRVKWQYVSSIISTGNISVSETNETITIAEKDFIYFYSIREKNDYNPILDRVMYNYMWASCVLFDELQRFCFIYKQGHQNVMLYQRKQHHSFRCIFDTSDCEHALGINLNSPCFVVAMVEND